MLNRTVMWLTWRQLFARRRIWFAIAFSLAPLLFTLVYRVIADDGDTARVGFYQALCSNIVIGTLLPLAGVLFGTTAFGGEVDDGTLVYLLVKPLPRWHVVLSKFVVAFVSAFAITLPGIILPWLVLRNPELSPNVVTAFVAAAGVAAAIYTALFLSLGLTTRRALVGGLIYVIGFEALLSRNLPGLKALSVREYATAIAQAASNGTMVFPGSISLSTVKWMGTIILVGALAWTIRQLIQHEVAERL